MKQTLLSLLTLVLLNSFSNRLYARSYPLYAVVNGTEMTLMCVGVPPQGYIEYDSQEWFAAKQGAFLDVTHVTIEASCSQYDGEVESLFYNFRNLVSISGLENLNTIGATTFAMMFANCHHLESVDISALNTLRVKSMKDMFFGCRELKSVNLSSLNTDSLKSMESMFFQCRKLESVNLSQIDTHNVTSMKQMFYECTALESLDLTSFDTRSVTSMEEMFTDCKALTEIKGIEGFSTPSVSSMGRMFKGCEKLTRLELKSFDTRQVTDMSEIFRDCLSLAVLDISGFNTASVTDMHEMFHRCGALTVLDVSSFNTASVTDMRRMFYACQNLEEIDLGGFNTANVTDMSEMFSSCQKLTTLDVSRFNTSAVTDMQGMFSWCQSLTALVVSGFNTANVTSMKDMFNMCRNLPELDVSKFNTANVTDMSGMFRSCSAVASLNVSGFSTTNVTDMSGMFSGCSTVESLDISSFNTANVTDMSDMFAGCSLVSLDVSSLNTASVTNMSGMFQDSKMTSLDLSSFNTSSVTNMQSMFRYCTSLTSLNLSSFNTSQVVNMHEMFYSCNKITSIDLSSFNTSNVTDMGYMFGCMNKVKTLDLRGFNTANVSNMEAMFMGCGALKTILIGDGWSTAGVTESKQMFGGSDRLVGEDGTKYDGSFRDKTRAHAGEGGYMCTKMPDKVYDCLYAEVSTDGMSMTIKCADEAPGGTILYEGRNMDSDVCQKITSVTLDASCSKYVGKTLRGLFEGFRSLTAIMGLENLNTAKVTDMSRMFQSCEELTELNLSAFNTSEVTDMSLMFNYLSKVVKLDLRPFVTAKVTNMQGMFFECSKLRTIAVGEGWNTDAVKSSAEMFSHCYDISGEDGTRYGYSDNDKTRAHTGSGGYLSTTLPEHYNDVLYAEVSADGTQVTLKCGESLPDGTVRYTEKTDWATDFRSTITAVTVDASCRAYIGKNLSYLFYNFSKLESINGLENLNTQGVNSMQEMFSGCSSLASLNLSAFNTASVTNLIYMFGGCSSIASIDLSAFDTEKVVYMSGMFSGCSSLTSITGLGRLKTSSVTDMRGMFKDCSLIASLDISSFNTAKVEDMSEMFSRCNALKTISGLDNINTTSVTNMSRMFQYMQNIKILDLRSFNTSKVTDMKDMFGNCISLKYILIGDGWNTSSVESSAGMFQSCIALIGADGINVDLSVTDKSSAHAGAGGYMMMQIPPKNTSALYAEISEDGTSMIVKCDDEAPEGTLEYTGWNINMDFSARPNITSLTIDTSCETYSGTMLRGIFDGFSNIKTINGLNHLNTDKVTDMSSMFSGCSSLTELDLSALNTANVTNMSGMFSGCSSLTELDFSAFNTASVTNMNMMFYKCSAFTELDLSNFNTASVTDMSHMFSDMYKLKNINLSSFNTSKVTNMKAMFSGLSEVIKLDLRSFNTSNVTDMSFMFNECSNLKTIGIGNGWDTSNVNESNLMFYKCNSLIGEDGTMVVYNVQDKTNAHSGAGGYMSSVVPEHYNDVIYAEISADGTSATLKCGDEAPEGTFVYNGEAGWANNFKVNITSVTFDVSCKTYKGTMLKNLFYYFAKLVSITDLTNLNTEKVTEMEYMFQGCTMLSSLDLSKFNTANVTLMYGMFSGCSSLKSLDLSAFVTTSVTSMAHMFDECRILETIYVGDRWSTENLFQANMFEGCYKIVGGQGTTYSSAQTQSDYARVDGGAEAPGYLTHISDKPETEMESMVTEVTVSTESLANESLNNIIVDDVYYNVGEDSYDTEDQSIVISKATDMEQIVSKEPGSGGVKFKFTGLIVKAAEGIGSITVNAKTSGNAQLALQVGDEEPKIASCTEQGDVTMPYVVSEDTYVYVYSVAGKNAARSTRAAANEVRLYSVTIMPDVSYIKGDASFDGKVNAEDIVEVTNGIMGNTSDNYSSRNADANRDGVVDIKDVLWIVNKISSSSK